MVLENPLPLFTEWLPTATVIWLIGLGILAASATLVCFLVSAVQRGPMAAAESAYAVISGGIIDLFRTSPRRVMALSGLAFREAMRRRVLVVFAVFVVVLLFAVWFLDRTSQEPAKLYLGFVMTASNYLVLLLALFLSVFSLPNDITKKTIYTVVTKPVRPTEIVLGRILGFTAIGTLMLFGMGFLSYWFVTRELDHRHDIDVNTLATVSAPLASGGSPIIKTAKTTKVNDHRHEVTLREDGTGLTDINYGHWHEVRLVTSGDKQTYEVGPPLDMLTARVPTYGKLRYRDRTGGEGAQAENVGNEWTYRQYIEGGTDAAAIWTFRGLSEGMFPKPEFPDGLRMQMTLSVFRTHKGTIDKPVLGDIRLRNPKSPSVVTTRMNFNSKEFAIYEHIVPWQLQDSEGNKLDLFKDLVDDEGGLEVLIGCVEPGQYFGAAQADLYFLAGQGEFLPNFLKGYLGMWLQMVLVIGMGVMFSTFLNGAVAMMSTLFALIMGMFTQSIGELIRGEIEGGGPFESLYRVLTHAPMTTPLDPGIGTNVIQALDNIAEAFLRMVVALVPDLPFFSTANYVSSGFDIPANTILIHAMTALGYLLPLFIAGYFFLKTREVAK